MIIEADVSVNYNPDEPFILWCDAPTYGVGAVISHRLRDNTDRLRTLDTAEQNYSQLDKEGASLKKFH